MVGWLGGPARQVPWQVVEPRMTYSDATGKKKGTALVRPAFRAPAADEVQMLRNSGIWRQRQLVSDQEL